MTAAPLTRADALRVLVAAKAYHSPLEVGEAAVSAWYAALAEGDVRSVDDAIRAVVRHYSAEGYRDPWIKPAHVISGVRQLRRDRILSGPTVAELMRDVDPAEPQYGPILRARTEALAAGVPVHHVLAIGGPR